MTSYWTPSGYNATLSGGPYDGMNANAWAGDIFLATITPRFVSKCVTVIVGIWEFIVLFPSEIVIWNRIIKMGPRGRSSFAPWTTLGMRYMMLTFSVGIAFSEWSTTMPSSAACIGVGVFVAFSGSVMNAYSSFAIAWRAQAVARGVVQTPAALWAVQAGIIGLIACEFITILFTNVWPTTRLLSWHPYLINGRCYNIFPRKGYPFIKFDWPRVPLFWYFIVTILFQTLCLLIVVVSLRRLATRSRGFSRFIRGMYIHSIAFYILTFTLHLMGAIWLSFGGLWLVYPITVVQCAVVIRILILEQDAARRPVDTLILEATAGPGVPYYDESRQTDTRSAAPGRETTVQFADTFGQRRMDFNSYGVDNLGQAFSQVDSRPTDFDDQSLEEGRSSSEEEEQSRRDHGARSDLESRASNPIAGSEKSLNASTPGASKSTDASEVDEPRLGYAYPAAGAVAAMTPDEDDKDDRTRICSLEMAPRVAAATPVTAPAAASTAPALPRHSSEAPAAAAATQDSETRGVSFMSSLFTRRASDASADFTRTAPG